MPQTPAFIRTFGTGPQHVLCLHCNASNGGQWRALGDGLGQDHCVLAPDLYGSGKSPEWPSDSEMALADEVALMEPALHGVASFAVVGHSYGGAVALKTALLHPDRVRAVAVYEPTLFALVEAQSPEPNGVDGIRHAVRQASAALESNNSDLAAQHFIDFWGGTGAWAATPPERKPALASAITKVRRWKHALFTEPTPLAAFAALRVPVLYMLGERSPQSAHAVAEVLVPALPNVTVLRFEKLGHMGPVTHPQVVNEAIACFLRDSALWRGCHAFGCW
jgi:pimeloyl-ACP methyl ester carboxylesterase